MSLRDPGQQESTLVSEAKKGDAEAFRWLVERYEQDAFRAAYLILRDADDAKDAAQEAFIRAHRSLKGFRAERPFRPWILKIAVNQALTIARKRKRRREVQTEMEAADPGYAIDNKLIGRERAALLVSALNEMREKDRATIYMRYFMNLSEREMAVYLDCAQGTVKSRMHRSLAKLKEIVARKYPELAEEIG